MILSKHSTTYIQENSVTTNRIAHRRWIRSSKSELATYLENLIGDDFIKDLSGISKLNAYKDDEKVLKDLQAIKLTKRTLATYGKETLAISIKSSFNL